ncbi:MAG TPA: hypothetical protein VIY90_21005, partial [Steroidobacteraceae bacterium]
IFPSRSPWIAAYRDHRYTTQRERLCPALFMKSSKSQRKSLEMCVIERAIRLAMLPVARPATVMSDRYHFYIALTLSIDDAEREFMQ